MDFRHYQEVYTDCNGGTMKETESIKSILKQVLICSTVCVEFFMAGLCVGSPTVYIPQLKKQGVKIDEQMASWLYATSGLFVLPWVIILPVLTKRIGRKIPQIITVVPALICFILHYLSKNITQILISQLFQGYLHAGNITVTILIVTEYSSPKYRGLFLTIKSASFFWGIWVANVIGTFYHWTNIPLLGIICTLYLFNIVFWPESPFWLASRGRLEECKKSFRWIHGLNKECEEHLREIISSQDGNKKNQKGVKISFFTMFKMTEFYKPLILSVIAISQYHFSGKIVTNLYVLDIFKKITADENSAYAAMLISDGVTVLGMYFGSFLSKVLNRRTLYMWSSFTGVAFLLIMSLYLFLVKLTVLEENKLITIILLTLYSVSISCGPMILSMSIYGEIVPIKFQASSYVMISLIFGALYSILVKLSPLIFQTFGVDGAFFFFGTICGLCTIYLYFFLPETKNKTQQEIEMYFKDKEIIAETRAMIAR